MPYSLKLKSSDNWVSSKVSGEMKKLNTDYLFETDNIYGFPKVSSDDFIPKDLTAFNVFHSKGHTINKEEAVSMYGNTNSKEAFAEAFTAYCFGVKSPKAGKAYYKEFKNQMKEAGLQDFEGCLKEV